MTKKFAVERTMHQFPSIKKPIRLMMHLKFLHEILPNRPHSRPLSINIHGDGEKHTGELDAADSKKGIL
jgi:hypothetical protein